MAWRALGRKGGCYSLAKAFIVTSRDSIALASKCRFDDSANAPSASVVDLLGSHFPPAFYGEGDGLPLFANKCSTRRFSL